MTAPTVPATKPAQNTDQAQPTGLVFQPRPALPPDIPPALLADIPIGVLTARKRHIEYLEHQPQVYVETDSGLKILYSLLIDQHDLKLLYDNAEGGVRLHFCREDSGEINITAVSVDKDGELNLKPDPHTGEVPVVNSLSPCPAVCASQFSETALNCWMLPDGTYVWIDPNNMQDGKVWYKKGSDGTPVYIDPPAGAPHI